MQEIFSSLDQLDVSYTVHEHPPVYTCEEADVHYTNIKGARSKNLFLRDKKGKQHFLVTLEADKQVDLKGLASSLGEDKISFASEKRLLKYLNVTPGSVSPFGLIFDQETHVKFFVSKGLLQDETQLFHPNDNTKTLALSTDDFKSFIGSLSHQVTFLDL